jgi:hypothetical protein
MRKPSLKTIGTTSGRISSRKPSMANLPKCQHGKSKDCAECEKIIAHRTEMIDFCPRCFGSSDSTSWNCPTESSYCFNCGGCPIQIPRWAVESLREQASWVGKRYYPHDEDKQTNLELKNLRVLVKKFPGRSAVRSPPLPDEKTTDAWWVTQILSKDDPSESVSVIVHARNKKEALEKCRLTLPYIPNPRKSDDEKR